MHLILVHLIQHLIYPFFSSWSTSYQDAIWLQETLWNTIRTLPNLRHLVLNLNFIKAQHLINLDLLTELESIIILNPIYPADWLFLNLATLLASSSKLTSLTIDMAHRYYPPYTMSESLHQLFQYSSDKHLPPRLRHLGLDYCLVLLDEVALHNLSHLTSFKLLHTQYEDLDPSCSEVASSPDDIWSAFTGSGIRLQELEHDTVTDSLLDYLLTFSGLKKLSLIGLGDNEQNLSDTPAYARFCTFVLPNHQETLEELNLTPYFDCRWCFGSHNAYVIAKCTKLKHISMSVISSQVGKTTSGQSKLHEEDVVVSNFACSHPIDLLLLASLYRNSSLIRLSATVQGYDSLVCLLLFQSFLWSGLPHKCTSGTHKWPYLSP